MPKTELLLHPKTAGSIAAVLTHPPQGLLITGVAGSGKDAAARYLAAGILDIPADKLAGYPYLHLLDPVEETISIEQVRELQQFLKLTVPSTDRTKIRRIVIISRASRMRSEAQNALLKTLEEPPKDTCIILTAESAEHLLSTITSRCQELAILPVSQAQAEAYCLSQGLPTSALPSAYALSMGQAGLLLALLKDESHPLRGQVTLAKSLLANTPGERLAQVDALSKDKPAIRLLIGAFGRITHAGLSAAGARNQLTAITQWQRRQEAVLEALEAFERNANTKLLLSHLFLAL